MSAPKPLNTPLKNYSVLLVEIHSTLEQRLKKSLEQIAHLKKASGKEITTTWLKKEPIGLVLIDSHTDSKVKECIVSHFDKDLNVAIIIVDAKKERLIHHQRGLREDVVYRLRSLEGLVSRLLQLVESRLEAFLLHETFHAVTVGIQESVIVVDRNLKLRSINPSARSNCHFPSTASLGFFLNSEKKAKKKLNTEGCIPKLSDLLKRVMNTLKAELDVRIKFTNPSKEKTEIRVSATPLIDRMGNCHGATAVILDSSSIADVSEINPPRQNYYRIIGGSPLMQEVYSLVESLASMDTTTLITGESGTGKELIAEALHIKGARSRGPLVKVNCSALSENLLESELFGHVKGAFTGAVKDRPGRFEVATGGTLFLDEIGEISLSMQTRLLRVLQERELERVGDSRTIKVDVRVVAATNKNLLDQIRLGKFREDLYFRLNVVEIALPPLRERLEDIHLLTNHFIQKFNRKYSKAIVGIQEGAKDLFLQYHWPGNIRELENAIEHAFVVCRQTTIRVKHLPKILLLGRPCADPVQIQTKLDEHSPTPPVESEKEGILRALETAHWNKKKAASLYGISRSTFYRKMEKLGIT